MSKTPIDRVKDGSVSASIFRNQNTKTGENFYTASISRSYKDNGSGDWKHVNNYSASDLQKLQNVAEIAAQRIEAHTRMHAPDQETPQDDQAPNLEDQRNTAMEAAKPEPKTSPEETPAQTR